jgi:hypothetical protein
MTNSDRREVTMGIQAQSGVAAIYLLTVTVVN